MIPDKIDYEDLKKRGFLKQRQDGFFILRTRMISGVYNKEALEVLAAISKKYGQGFVHATVRQGIEIPFIKYEDIPLIEEELKKGGVVVGVSGARLRTVTTCPGNNWCRMGLINTFSLEGRIENELGIKCGLDLPHKFKIAISGCPNGCTRPQFTDIGIHGQVDPSSADKRIGYTIYVGGSGGRSPRAGLKLEKIYDEDGVLVLIKRIVEFYKNNAKARQRLGALIDERGKDFYCDLGKI